MTPCILWGGTGQAKVVRPILARQGCEVLAVFDNRPIASPFVDVEVLGGWSEFEQRVTEFAGFAFAVTIGGGLGGARVEIGRKLKDCGLVPMTAIHEASFVAHGARIGEGCQILALAAVCEEVELGDYTIVNTSATVDHECKLGNGVHVMPGATIAGCAEIGDFATIGANATILPRIRVGPSAFVGAGAVVTRDVAPASTVVGVPARLHRMSDRRPTAEPRGEG